MSQSVLGQGSYIKEAKYFKMKKLTNMKDERFIGVCDEIESRESDNRDIMRTIKGLARLMSSKVKLKMLIHVLGLAESAKKIRVKRFVFSIIECDRVFFDKVFDNKRAVRWLSKLSPKLRRSVRDLCLSEFCDESDSGVLPAAPAAVPKSSTPEPCASRSIASSVSVSTTPESARAGRSSAMQVTVTHGLLAFSPKGVVRPVAKKPTLEKPEPVRLPLVPAARRS